MSESTWFGTSFGQSGTGASGPIAGDRATVGGASMLDGLDADVRALLEGELEPLHIPGGQILFEEGQPADAMYLVRSGILAVVVGKPLERGQLIAQIYAGETVGEMALLSQRPRSASVIALRDSSLLRMSRDTFAKLMELDPRAMLRLALALVDRLEHTTRKGKPVLMPRTLALLPLDERVPIAPFADSLASALAASGAKLKILDEAATGQNVEFFYSVEMSHQLTLYRGSGGAHWDPLCIRRADRVVLVASAKSTAERCRPIPGLADLPWRMVELVLLQDDGAVVPLPARPWLARFPVNGHYHVRSGSEADFGRLARCLTSRAVGLVLSGGGARGYAQIGVLKAMQESRIPIDLVGGVSFGSIVAGAVALEWGEQEFRERFGRAFVASNPVADYAIPLVALTKGREVGRRLQEHFGDRRMEDLWRPCFAVAANLTSGGLTVQREGPVWEAMRASAAIPGLLPPWIVNGEVLVDGASMNNLPTDVMSKMCSGPIVAIDVGDYRGLRPQPPSRRRWLRQLLTGREPDGLDIVNLLLRSAAVSGEAQTRLCRDLADVLLEPPLLDVGLCDWRAFDRAIDAGYRYTLERLDDLSRVHRNVPPAGSLPH
jgi:NTE family protein